MNTRPLVAVFAALTIIAAGAPAASGAPASYTNCSGSFGPQGQPGSFYRDIRAKGVTCATARAVTKVWVVKHKSGSTNPTKKSIVSGYACTGDPATSGPLRILCVRDRGRTAIRFLGSP